MHNLGSGGAIDENCNLRVGKISPLLLSSENRKLPERRLRDERALLMTDECFILYFYWKAIGKLLFRDSDEQSPSSNIRQQA